MKKEKNNLLEAAEKNRRSWSGVSTVLRPSLDEEKITFLQEEIDAYFRKVCGQKIHYQKYNPKQMHISILALTRSQPSPVHEDQLPPNFLDKLSKALHELKAKKVRLKVKVPMLTNNGYVVLPVKSSQLERLQEKMEQAGLGSPLAAFHLTLGYLEAPSKNSIDLRILQSLQTGSLPFNFEAEVTDSNGVWVCHYKTRTFKALHGTLLMKWDGSIEEDKSPSELHLLNGSVEVDSLLGGMKKAARTAIKTLRHSMTLDYQAAVQFTGNDEEKPIDDRTRQFDLTSQQAILNTLRETWPGLSIVILTEESPYEIVLGKRDEAQIVLLIDPADSSDLLAAGLGGAVSLTAIHAGSIVAAVVGDVKSGALFYATQEGAYVEYEGENMLNSIQRLTHSNCRNLKEAFASTFALKPERWAKVIQKPFASFGTQCYRFDSSIGGPLPLCLVAAGRMDLVFELFRGYKNIDLCPGWFIAEKAGAICRSADGKPLTIPFYPSDRQKFFCAATKELFWQAQQFLIRPNTTAKRSVRN